MSASEFFDAMYARADGDDQQVPWQHAASRSLIGAWIDELDPSGVERALVVAAGLGDDAAALAGKGVEVVAFDQAPTAIEWARQRHPDAGVDWQVADLFDPPADWRAGFDLVIEVFTVQSIEPSTQLDAAAAVRSFVAPGGTLVVVALVHDGTVDPEGPPWPLHPDTLRALAEGFEVVDRSVEPAGPAVELVQVEAVAAGG